MSQPQAGERGGFVTRTSYAALRRRMAVGLRLRITRIRTGESFEAEITGVDKNGIWWKRCDGEPMTFKDVSGIRPKLNDGKNYWPLGSGVTVESLDAWQLHWPPLRYEIIGGSTNG